jgi:hypothetical protein
MSRLYNYQRENVTVRMPDRVIDLGNAGVFNEIIPNNSNPREELKINGSIFTSIHVINPPAGIRIFTALRSEEDPSVLLIIWRGFPYYRQIEVGGDLMLQMLHSDKRVVHLIIDNTYVRSGWMDDKMTDYLNNGWLPGLIQLGLKGFCHLQAESYLGGLSFKKFGEMMSENISKTAQSLGKEPFAYYPIKTSEMSKSGVINEEMRLAAFKESLRILKSLR